MIGKELREHYKANMDRNMIEMAFNASTKSDQQWVRAIYVRSARVFEPDSYIRQKHAKRYK